MGCTVEALDVPRKMLAISIAPHSAAMPSGDVLHANVDLTIVLWWFVLFLGVDQNEVATDWI